jgi:alpha-beta hydrolase superfamily lysophospholipase
MIWRLSVAIVVGCAGLSAPDAHATPSQPLSVTVRGQSLKLEVYVPRAGAPVKGTIIMASGDVGWVGLAVTLAEFLSDTGYVVAGVNVRQYLSVFADGAAHLQTEQIPGDYEQFAAALRSRGWLARPTVLSGVSEGAALALAAATAPASRRWVDGVITMGLPATAELAWRWKDALTWMTKTDADEPSFSPHEIIAKVAPIPLWMLQSTSDEYVPEADYRRFERLATEPKRLVLIDAKNHRFTDKLPELKAQVRAGLVWIDGFRKPPGP